MDVCADNNLRIATLYCKIDFMYNFCMSRFSLIDYFIVSTAMYIVVHCPLLTAKFDMMGIICLTTILLRFLCTLTEALLRYQRGMSL